MLDHFFQFGNIPANAISGYYSYKLVFLSYVIAVFASLVALNFAGRLRLEDDSKMKMGWLVGGSVAMGATTAMYVSKQDGRNRSSIYDAGTSSD